MKSIIAERFMHKGERRIALKFPFDTTLNSILKQFIEARWSMTMSCWHIPDETSVVEKLPGIFGLKATIDLSGIVNAEKKLNNPDNKSISREHSKIIIRPDLKSYTGNNIIIAPTDIQTGSLAAKDEFTESKQGVNK